LAGFFFSFKFYFHFSFVANAGADLTAEGAVLCKPYDQQHGNASWSW